MLNESLAGGKGIARLGRSAANRLGDQASIRSHKTLHRPGFPDFVFAFHDRDEIGPRMLARIGKHTGLTAHDL